MSRVWFPLLLSLSLLFGCGAKFDPQSEIKSLRVLAVKKDKPYAQPGDQVNLQMLWVDGKGHDQVQSMFLGGCVNPPGDLYYGCFDVFTQPDQGGKLPFTLGDTFSVKVPGDIITGRKGGFQPGQPHYGLYIVFFAVCGGSLSLDTTMSPDEPGAPVRCLDSSGEPLGSDDFVVGYTSIYSFEGVSNENPSFTLQDDGSTSFQVAGESVPADCVGDACQTAPAVEVDCESTPERCVKVCADDGDGSCPAIDVAPQIAQKVERDDVSSKLFDSDVSEQMWVNYYVDHGSISDVRLVNDSRSGWNPKYRGQLRAPKDAGPLQVWSVVHDNRGGMDFARVTLKAR